MQKITPPRLVPLLHEGRSFAGLLSEEEGDLAEYLFKDESIEDVRHDFTGISSCSFVNCNFSECKIGGAHV